MHPTLRAIARRVPFARAVYRKLRPLPPGPRPPLAIHAEELMRFRRYSCFHVYVAPHLPADAVAELRVPGLPAPVPLAKSIRPDIPHMTLLTAEVLMPERGRPVHHARLVVRYGRTEYDYGPLDQHRPPDPWVKLNERFNAALAARPGLRVLEMGSRTRDNTRNVARKDRLANAGRYVGFDILPGPNVDVVGDAHTLSRCFPTERFDLVYSDFVFEHLLAPWQVVLELNAVLDVGGEVFANTNHSIGLHDLPWDFFRFSDTCWRALFNADTGFELLDAAVGEPVRLTPLRYHDGFDQHEGGVGLQASGVWARKVGPPRVAWPADTARELAALARAYPEQITD